MARPSLMDKYPQLREVVADMYVDGQSNQAIANAINGLFPELNVYKDTITDYRRHPSVAPLIRAQIEERRQRIVRQVDSRLAGRLEKEADKMDTKTLLEIRKTLAGEKIIHDDKRDEGDGSMTDALFDLAEKDPEAAQRIMEAQAAGE